MGSNSARTGAQVVVESLEKHGVQYVFGIPGAKIDKVFDTLVSSSIQTVVCRHEQNAAFIAGGIGRLTGKAGVAIATSGPGVSNLTTGLLTANSEGDPLVALGGAVPTSQAIKQVHQTFQAVSALKPVTKFCAEAGSPDSVGEIMANAFAAAESDRPGAAFVSLPKNVMEGESNSAVLTGSARPAFGPGSQRSIEEAARIINGSRRAVCHSDVVTKEGQFPGISYPRVPGHEVAGTIDQLGANVKRWSKGDRVGVGWHGGQDGTCLGMQERRLRKLCEWLGVRSQL